MKNYYKNFKRAWHLLPTLLFLLIGTGLLAQTSVWTGDVDTDWSNGANWSGGVPTTGFTAVVPGAPQGGVFPIYEGSFLIDYTIQNGGTLTFNTVIYNIGVIINFEGGMVNSNELFINAGSITFDNDGEFKSYSNLENYGIIDNAASGALKILDGSFNNYGAVTNFGNVSNVSGTAINNYGVIESVATLTINGSFDNYGSLNSAVGSTLILNGSGYLTNHNDAYFECTCDLTNSSTITNDGEMQVNFSSNFDNDNTLLNNGTLGLSGNLVNDGTVQNNSTLRILDAGVFTNNTTFGNNGDMDLSVCGTLIQNAAGNIGGNTYNDGLIYEINGTVSVSGGEFGDKFTSITDKKNPIAGCKPNVFVQLSQSGSITIPTNTIDKGSYGSCAAQLTSVTVTPNSFTTADVGQQVVTLDIEDEFGFTSSCDAIITVLEYQEPIAAIDDPNIDATCPQDINITALAGAVSATATWTEPIASTNCTDETIIPGSIAINATVTGPGETSGGGDGVVDCSQSANEIAGLVFMGEFNNSKYYCSQTNNYTWHQAKALAESHGGYLAVVSDYEENNFIKNVILADYVWIGLTDEASEGNFSWTNGSPLSYTNWSYGEPNNSNGAEHYTRLLKSNGQWTDRDEHWLAEAFIEIPCPLTGGVDCNQIPNEYSGLVYMGEHDDSKYFCSNTNDLTWHEANNLAATYGAHLAVVNNYSENEFIRNSIIADYVWIGYTDEVNEGIFSWVSGSSSYNNWSYGEPNNSNGIEHYTRLLKSNGQWTDRDQHWEAEAVFEFECPISEPLTCDGVDVEFVNNGDCSVNVYWLNGNTEVFYFTLAAGQTYLQPTVEGTQWLIQNDSEDAATTFQVEGCNDYQIVIDVTCESSTGEPSELVTEQIQGQPSGSNFPIGTTVIAYKFTDDCGNEEICLFDVTIEAVPTNLEVTCVENIVVDALPGAGSSVVSWTEPTAATDCFINNAFINRTDEGPANGGAFPVGTTFINYSAIDSCLNFEGCVFTVTVNQIPAILELTNCPGDINSSDEIVTWNLPTATSNCFEAGVTITQIAGPAPGSAFPDGTTEVAYLITDPCGNTQFCSFNVNATLCSPAGTACNDGDDCTTNDQEDGACNCAGTFADADGDGVCDADDICAGSDDNADADGDGTPDGCDGCDAALAGTTCDDLDACTTGDVYDAACNCAGTFADADGDGVCAVEDCDDNDASLPATPGASCDDGDAATINDVILADGCGCAGEVVPTGGCDDIIITEAAGVITTSGYSDPIVFVKIFNYNWSEVVFDSGMLTNNEPQTITGLGEGTYHVYVKTYDSNWSQLCDESMTVTISGAPGLPGISIGDVTVNEEDGTATLEICLTNTSDEDVTVAYTTQEVLALEGSDYTAVSGTATILAGELCTTVEVEILDDEFSEGTETFSVDIGNATGAVITNAKGVVTILDTDGAPAGGCDDITITENGGVITTSGYNYPIVFVKIYDMSWNTVFDSGMITDNADQLVTGLAEGSYNVYVKTYDSSWTQLCDASDLITITGTPVLPSIFITDVTVDEEAGSALVDVCLTFASAEEVIVDYTTTDGSAFSGDDYGTVTGTATIAAGELCTQILVPIADDSEEEATEVLYIDLSAPVNGIIGDDQGTVTILDTDEPSNGGCDDITITENGGVITTSGYNYPIVFVKVYDSSWSIVFDSGMLSSNEPQTITGLPEGTYNVYVKTYNMSWAQQCDEHIQITITEPSSNPCDDFGGDSDGDGVCDDNDICAGSDDNIDSDGDGIPDGCDDGTTCVEREATNVIACSGGSEGLPYGGWLKIEGMDASYDLVNSQLVEHEEGTATLTGSWVNQTVPECIFDFVIELSGRTTEPNADGYKPHNCLDTNYDDFYYYNDFTGTLTGSNEMAGASISIESFGASFQIGVGANATGADLVFGASGWFSGDLLAQPANGWNLVLNPNANGHLGDININLSGGHEVCLDIPVPTGDNTPCGTVVTTGNGSINIGGYSEPVAVIQIFNDKWELVYSCMGDCANPLTVDNLTSGSYLVKVNLYDESWSSVCTEYAEYHTVTTSSGLEGQTTEILFFNAAKDDRQVSVNWATNTEYKNDYFLVERSVDGLNFEALFDVRSLNEEGDAAIYYQDSDVRPNLGINYYRLKQVYENGTYRYSNVKTVEFDVDLFDFTVYPNPTVEMVYVNLKEYEGKAATIQLLNSLGAVIETVRIDALTEESIGFDVASYSAGVYGMTVQVDGRKRLTRLFVKSRL